MKIYIVSDEDENLHTMFFGNKKKAIKYYNELKETEPAELKTIDVEPNRKGILFAMKMACTYVGSSCGGTEL
tara:strand:- start:199 stop:414 length:216 start_codon:yes stop_codon:yes gene_type:complete